MAGALADALRDLDAAALVRDNESLGRVRAALEANTTAEEAQTICESLTRLVANRVGERLTTNFARALQRLTDLQEGIQSTYDAAVQGGQRAPAGLSEELRPRLTERAELLDQISRIVSDPEEIETSAASTDVAAELEDQGRPASEAPDEDRADISMRPDDPDLPLGSRGAAAEVRRGLEPIQPRDRRYRFSPTRRANRPYAHEQFMLLRGYDPVAAGRGYEVRLNGWDFDPATEPGKPPTHRPLDLDGIRPMDGDRFEMLEAKYAGEELGPEETPPQDQIDHMRGQFSRQMAAMATFGDQCAGLRIVTNSPALAEYMTGLLQDLAGTRDLASAKIVVEVRPL
jgi:hypothetical protein